MAATLKLGDKIWATKEGSLLAYNDENNNFKPLPFDFTRASSATRVNKQGLIETVASGVPRIDFTDANGALKLEPQRTNRVRYSENFSQWTTSGSATITTGITDPSGGSSAATISNISSVNDGAVIYSNPMTISAGNIVSQSIYLKGSGTISISMERGISGDYWVYDKIVTLTSSWQRFDNFAEIPTAAGGFHFYVKKIIGTTATSVDIAFAQLEQGSYATSYIPTQGSAVTVVADACSQTVPSGIIGQTEGTLFVDFVYSAKTGNNRFSISAGSTTNWIFIGTPEDASTNASRFYIKTNNIVHVDVGGSSYFTFGQRYKLALAYKSGDWAVYGNGTLLYSGTDAIAAVSSPLSVFNFFSASGGVCDASELMNQALLFKTRLSNEELADLTTI
jgi:hypothetical protein